MEPSGKKPWRAPPNEWEEGGWFRDREAREEESASPANVDAHRDATDATRQLLARSTIPPHIPSSAYPPTSRRGSSAKASSTSLQALNEDTVTEVRSSTPGKTSASLLRNPTVQRIAESDSAGTRPPTNLALNTNMTNPPEYPVYPDQSYAVLQSQFYPPPYQPFLRSRSSHPSPYAIFTEVQKTKRNSRDYSAHTHGSRTAGNTPVSSPGLFTARSTRSTPPMGPDDDTALGSPYLHPTHLQPPKETHTVEVDRDLLTGNKLINQYEILDELGRGEHGKVKLGRHVTTGQKVAIKIVQRYSKRRRLGKLGNPEDKVKKEVAILKKARHPNVVSLLEVIDDPNRQKVYIVLEFVENGEICWRKRGVKEIVLADKRRFEREKKGIPDSPSFIEENQQYVRNAKVQRRQRERIRERRQASHPDFVPAWSLEHGGESDDEIGPEISLARIASNRPDALDPSPSHSFSSTTDWDKAMRDPTLAAIEGSMYGAYASEAIYERRQSIASSIFGYAPSEPEWPPADDDLSYVPCLTMSEARKAFQDSVLGLEYLHYQGIIHRDIKPANLLVTGNHCVKISDFGVSYLGRPIRDEEEEQVTETDAAELDDARELSKTVGTPAFYAPELCFTGPDFEEEIGATPKITGAIDVWSLGVTLYGMIYGRLPFVQDEECTIFQAIVKKDVFIPRKRLKAVDEDPPSLHGSHVDLGHVMNSNKRADDELVYEEIDDDLCDLLKRLLTKNPAQRITLKEIKHHPWVIRDLQDPTEWIEGTDPAHQSKGKRIEVSTEEVSGAVTKMPFIQRVRSNVARWGNLGNIFGLSKDGRKRAPSSAASEGNHSVSSGSSSTAGRENREIRRASLRGDEEMPTRSFRGLKDTEHPLAQSVTASPESVDDRATSYFPVIPPTLTDRTASLERLHRPEHPGRATSTVSNAESTKTVRPAHADVPATSPGPRAITPTLIDALGSTSITGIFGGAGRRIAQGLQSQDWRGERSALADARTVEGDGHSGPSIAVSSASATGQVQPPELTRDQSPRPPVHPDKHRILHRRNKSHNLAYESSAESFDLAREALLRQRQHPERAADAEWGKYRSERERDSTHSPHYVHVEHFNYPPEFEWAPPDRKSSESSQEPHASLPASAASATTISSSGDGFASEMSHSASHPSIPSVISGASSISGDGSHVWMVEREKAADNANEVPAMLRTGDTVTARQYAQRMHDEDESREYGGDDEEDESEDEGIVFGKKKSAPKSEGKTNA